MQGLVVTEDLQEFLSLVHLSIAKVIFAENFFVTLYNKDTAEENTSPLLYKSDL